MTKFVWDEFSRYGDVLVELDTNNNITTSYVYGAMGLLSQKQGSDIRYLLTDVQNSTRVLLNANHTVAADYAYDAFGSLTSTDSGLTKYLYTGQQFDATTQLYSLRARYYAPEQGRFLSRDTWEYDLQNPRELNRYVYTANNPIMGSDPSGFADGIDSYGRLTAMGRNIMGGLQKAASLAKNDLFRAFVGGGLGWLFGQVLVDQLNIGEEEKPEDFLRTRNPDLNTLLNHANNLADFIIAGLTGVFVEYFNASIPQWKNTIARPVSNFYLGYITGSIGSLMMGIPKALKDSIATPIAYGEDSQAFGELIEDVVKALFMGFAVDGVTNGAIYAVQQKLGTITGVRAFLFTFVDVVVGAGAESIETAFDRANLIGGFYHLFFPLGQ